MSKTRFTVNFSVKFGRRPLTCFEEKVKAHLKETHKQAIFLAEVSNQGLIDTKMLGVCCQCVHSFK